MKTQGTAAADAARFWQEARAEGFLWWSGVPCSLFDAALARIPEERDIRYVAAVREDAALGVASGFWLAGHRAGILIQNSGLGNCMNALTSFNLVYKVPVLIVISWRGEGGRDAPEHVIMGPKMHDFLRVLDVPARVLLRDDFASGFRWARETMEAHQTPAALVVRKGVFGATS